MYPFWTYKEVSFWAFGMANYIVLRHIIMCW